MFCPKYENTTLLDISKTVFDPQNFPRVSTFFRHLLHQSDLSFLSWSKISGSWSPRLTRKRRTDIGLIGIWELGWDPTLSLSIRTYVYIVIHIMIH